MIRISAAIASMGRVSLKETLKSLAAAKTPEGVTLEAIVADDSLDGAASRLCAELDLPGFEVRCLPVAARNISIARNALLDAVAGEWLVFVDDDEWVEEDWLVKLLACARDFEADVVIAPVIPLYPAETPDWFRRANPLYVDWGAQGKRLATGRGGNTLVKVGMIRRLGLRFDPALGRSGGEDTAFFSAAAQKGAVIVACDEAIAREHVPLERIQPDYVLRRAVRSGQSYGRMALERESSAARKIFFACDALAKTAVGGALALILRPIDRSRSFQFQRKYRMNLGKLRAILRLPLAELY